MKRNCVIHYSSGKHQFASSEFEDIFFNSKLKYSLRHLVFSGNNLQDKINEALYKSLQVCYLAGINSKHHFKQIYVYDADTRALYLDWLMSKNGFNLMVMQINSVNKEKALWLWKLATL